MLFRSHDFAPNAKGALAENCSLDHLFVRRPGRRTRWTGTIRRRRVNEARPSVERRAALPKGLQIVEFASNYRRRELAEREVDFRAVPLRDLVERLTFRFVVRLVVRFLAAPLFGLVDFLAIFRLVVRLVVRFLAAPLFALVDFFATFRLVVRFLAAPALDLVDFFFATFRLVVRFLAAPLFALVDFLAVLRLVPPDRDLVDRLRDVADFLVALDRVAISVGSSLDSCGYPSICGYFAPAPEFAKQPHLISAVNFRAA